jgi:hypothetical protein
VLKTGRWSSLIEILLTDITPSIGFSSYHSHTNFSRHITSRREPTVTALQSVTGVKRIAGIVGVEKCIARYTVLGVSEIVLELLISLSSRPPQRSQSSAMKMAGSWGP